MGRDAQPHREADQSIAQQAPQQRDTEGYVLTLDAPSYMAVMMHAEDRSLREELYRAYVSLASDIGANAGA